MTAIGRQASSPLDAYDDLNVSGYDPLLQPALLKSEIPLSDASKTTIALARRAANDIIAGEDNRVIVIVGPCSIHSPEQALEYARLLRAKIDSWPNLLIIMRAYFEKPRTTVGWKGLINDPNLDGSFMINKGLRVARQLLCDLTELGLPVGCELLDTISPQFLSDCISWGAIGARTTESQLHRELASGMSFPIGFKNGTDGGVTVAVDAMRAASHPHAFMGITSSGLASIVKTRGNPAVHIILRGGSSGTNYAPSDIAKTKTASAKARPTFHPSIMVDCSHGNSLKDHRNQAKVNAAICEQLRAGEDAITGVMIESHLEEGRQDVPTEGPSGLKRGVSITDACVNFVTTVQLLSDLNEAVGVRNSASKQKHANGHANGNGTAH
ncbi:uncharacterized protein L969DRAFT_84526 [Mixia osmundae IAM 14324]|uniref:Phospho-2-dehydro-3-deoxyheptonate aldolase n=1 Tax=Mixia osmundae (strain CBS 9802 / IAM 14324 / JCM 22182 / KY 12970) TaxID=764103 RepID=G7E579_MIXOS|nr:uncharacterized protein L969DRAFT_84526 [Mixia osmundae IAM 14324]KEI42654.1 hypothetical protein L969DRAFT_84526 [Mixia osmundae IAM 14324]GAA97989.1 hypothetical protein E5Q_04669 [Mixia osmundae IAM 14324]